MNWFQTAREKESSVTQSSSKVVSTVKNGNMRKEVIIVLDYLLSKHC